MSSEAKSPVLQMRHSSKRFDTTQALDDVSLELYPGEIHALMGENGAGKSTLIKIMTGIYHPDDGEMLLDGNPIRVRRLHVIVRRMRICSSDDHHAELPTSGDQVAEHITLSKPCASMVIRYFCGIKSDAASSTQAHRV